MKDTNLNNAFKLVITGLPILTGTLYLLGANFWSGYFKVFGIDDTMYPVPIDKILFHGFFAVTDLGVRVLSLLVLVTVFVFLFTFSYQFSKFILGTLTGKSRKHNVDGQVELNLSLANTGDNPKTHLTFSDKLSIPTILLFLIVITILGFGLFAEWCGKFYAKDFIAAVSKGEEFALIEVTTRGGAQKYEGYSIVCGEIYCSYWVSGKTVSIPVGKIDQIVVLKTGLPRSSTIKINPNT